MRIAEVIGHLTLSKHHPSVEGARWLVAMPLSLAHLTTRRAEGVSPPVNEELIVYDELGASHGCLIGISEGTEASMPFRPARKPVDAYAACILDSISVEGIESAAG